MSLLENKYDIGVIVGRFQVPELSEGHKKLINSVAETHKQLVIIVGVSPTLGTKSNPLGYTARMRMVQQEFPNAIVAPLMDIHSDKQWSITLDLLIRALCPMGSACLYGGRDSFIKSYKGALPTFEMAVISEHQGTQIRQEVGKEVLDTVDFRKGVIWSCQNQYPKVYPTVDMAVVRSCETGKSDRRIKLGEVLLARRLEGDKLQFPGGFVDPTDESLEEAARRELMEEFGLEVDNWQFVGSHRIDDWRYTGTERIITSLFRCDYIFGSPHLDYEFHSFEWLQIRPESLDFIKKGHKPLFELLLKNQEALVERKKTNG